MIARQLYLIFPLCFLPDFVASGLTVSAYKTCGENRCAVDEYCRNSSQTCQKCSDICNSSNHNYQDSTCQYQCQDYIHDQRYQKKEMADLQNLSQQVQRMYVLVAVMVAINAVLLVIILAGGLSFWLKSRKNLASKVNTKLNSFKNQYKTEKDAKGVKTDSLKLEIPPPLDNHVTPNIPKPSSQKDDEMPTPPTTSTPISKRHPCEDSTLDYAYDNPALSTSQDRDTTVSYVKRETTF